MNRCQLDEATLVQQYHDQELKGDALQQFEQHLRGCGPCKAELAELAEIRGVLRAGFTLETPPIRTSVLVRHTVETQLQRSRRIAWGLFAAASVLFVSSVFLLGYTRSGQGASPTAMAGWEENVLSAPILEEDYGDVASRTLVAIHIPNETTSENGR